MNRAAKGACIATLLVCCWEPLCADTISFTTSKDNTLFQDSFGQISNGAGPHFFVGETNNGDLRRGLVAFDVAGAVPAGSTINAASLKLFMSRSLGNAGTLELRRVLADWGEGTSNSGEQGGGGATAGPGDATWLNTFYNTGTWSSAGGDFSGTASSTVFITGIASYTVSSTTQLVSDVQSWLSTPSGNFGWLFLGNESTFTTAARFDTKENAVAANRPYLNLDVTLPSGTSAWRGDLDANWTDGTQWAGAVPNSTGAHAFFGNVITAPRTVTLNSPQTVGRITLNSTRGYTITGASQLTIDGSAGTIDVNSGTHHIDAPLMLAANTTINIAAASTLTLGGDMTSAATATLTKSGTGLLALKHARAAALTINQGMARILPNGTTDATSRVGGLTIAGSTDAWTSTLDLSNNDLVLDYSGPTPVATVQNLIKNGFNSGAWSGNGIVSSLANANAQALGYADNAVLALGTFSGQSVGSSSILVKYTRFGDSNLDGRVDIKDLRALATHYNTTGNVWTSGDFNYDGLVNVLDLNLLVRNWQAGVPPLGPVLAADLSGNTIPEPTAIGLIASLSALVLGWPRRRGK